MSPDGKVVAFTTYDGVSDVTHDALAETTPVYSPDGKRIVFATSGGKGRRNGTWTISASGKHRHRIGPPRAALSWQPLPAG